MTEQERILSGPAVADARRRARMTQRMLAAASGISRETISRIERGIVTRSTQDVYAAVADALGSEVSDLAITRGEWTPRHPPREGPAVRPGRDVSFDGQEVRRRRKAVRLTCAWVGARLGVSKATIQRWEVGVNPPLAHAAEEYLALLDDAEAGKFWDRTPEPLRTPPVSPRSREEPEPEPVVIK